MTTLGYLVGPAMSALVCRCSTASLFRLLSQLSLQYKLDRHSRALVCRCSTASLYRLLSRLSLQYKLDRHSRALVCRYSTASRAARGHRCDPVLRFANVSQRAAQFTVLHRIRTKPSCPYESHRMGKAERMNRTLEAMARTLLLAAGMDPCLTLEAWL